MQAKKLKKTRPSRCTEREKELARDKAGAKKANTRDRADIRKEIKSMQRDKVRYRPKKAYRETEQIFRKRDRAGRDTKADEELKTDIRGDQEPRRDTQTEDVERQSKI